MSLDQIKNSKRTQVNPPTPAPVDEKNKTTRASLTAKNLEAEEQVKKDYTQQQA